MASSRCTAKVLVIMMLVELDRKNKCIPTIDITSIDYSAVRNSAYHNKQYNVMSEFVKMKDYTVFVLQWGYKI